MRIEHVALNVADPDAMARWYCAHLGMRVARRMGRAYFLADAAGQVVLEIYRNPPDRVPDYAGMDPLILHLAFSSSNLAADYARLAAAGATPLDAPPPEGAYGVCMLRDPWGLAIQLARREEPLLA